MFPLQIRAIYFSNLFCNIHLKILVSEVFVPDKLSARIFVESKYGVGPETVQVSLVRNSDKC